MGGAIAAFCALDLTVSEITACKNLLPVHVLNFSAIFV